MWPVSRGLIPKPTMGDEAPGRGPAWQVSFTVLID